MQDGWVKLHRATLLSPVFADAVLLRLWIYLLLRASHQPRDVLVGMQTVHLLPGQLVTGRKRLAHDLNMDESAVRRRLKTLERLQLVTIRATSKYSVVTLVNWDIDQSGSTDHGHEAASKRPADDRQADHKQERISKKEEHKKKEKAAGGADAARFTPPTLAEVQSYVAERHSPVIPQEFIDFYAAKGWMVGKTPMKDWKAACRNAEAWERWRRRGTDAPYVYDYGSMEGSL